MPIPLEHQFFQQIIDFLVEPVFVKDDEHRVIHANQAFYDMFQLAEQEVIGFTLAEAVPEHERKHFLRVDRAVLDTGTPDLREEELTIGGRTRTIVTSKRRHTNWDGAHFLIGSIQDITEMKGIQRRLEEEKTKLQETLEELGTLRGVLPICAYCKKIREDDGAWSDLERYVSRHSSASFTHGICADCAKEHFPAD